MIRTLTPLHMQALTMLYMGRQLPALTVKAVSASLIDEGFAELEQGALGEVLSITDAGRDAVEAVRDREIDLKDEPSQAPPAWKRTTDEQPARDPLERHTSRLVCNQIAAAVLGLMLVIACAFGVGFQLSLLRDEVKKNNAAVAEVLTRANTCIETLRVFIKAVEPTPVVEPAPPAEAGPEDLINLLPLPKK